MKVLFKLRRRQEQSGKLREKLIVCSGLLGALVVLWLIYKVPWINDWLGTDPGTIKSRVAYVTAPLMLVLYLFTKLQW
jgi:hypothetical protein